MKRSFQPTEARFRFNTFEDSNPVEEEEEDIHWRYSTTSTNKRRVRDSSCDALLRSRKIECNVKDRGGSDKNPEKMMVSNSWSPFLDKNMMILLEQSKKHQPNYYLTDERDETWRMSSIISKRMESILKNPTTEPSGKTPKNRTGFMPKGFETFHKRPRNSKELIHLSEPIKWKKQKTVLLDPNPILQSNNEDHPTHFENDKDWKDSDNSSLDSLAKSR